MKLTAINIKNIKPQDKPKTYACGNRLELHVSAMNKDGGCKKTWRLRYHLAIGEDKKARAATLGTWPDMSMAQAIDAASAMRKKLKEGINPVFEKQTSELRQAVERALTFRAALADLMEHKLTEGKAQDTIDAFNRGMRLHVLPSIGDWPIKDISFSLLSVLMKEIRAKQPKSANKLARQIREVMKAGSRRANIPNVAAELNELAPQTPHIPRPALTEPAPVGQLMRDINGLETIENRLFLQMIAYLYVRTNELAKAPWTEIDFDAGVWTIPAKRMKMRNPHIIPLPRQALAILRQLKLLAGTSPWIFQHQHKKGLPSHKDRASEAMHRWLPQYDNVHVPHGFRSTASTTLRECFYDRQIVEKSLSHKIGQEVEVIYNRAGWLDYQRGMRQAYCDYLDELAKGVDGKVARAKLQVYEPDCKRLAA